MIALTLAAVCFIEVTAAISKTTKDVKCSTNNECNFAERMPYSCKCDDKCSLYGDCCPTAHDMTKFDPPKFECSSLGVYMISHCPNVTEPILKEKCEGISSLHKTPLELPVADMSSGFTYRNYYCAECNGAEKNNIIFWNAIATCPGAFIGWNIFSKNDLEEKFEFNIDEERWGIRDRKNKEKKFYPCDILPAELFNHARPVRSRLCAPSLISNCSVTWNDEQIEKRCRSLLAPVSHKGMHRYKNMYCALCHKVPLSEMSCPFNGGYRVRRDSHTIKIVLDKNMEKKRCKEGEVVYNGRCRNVRCISPRFILRRGQCILRGRRRSN